MTTRIDMHTHTRSSDGTGTPLTIANAALKAGLDGICLTDHNLTYHTENLEVAKACREAGLLIFHGAEYSSGDGHILIYGVNLADLQLGFYKPMQTVIDWVNEAGGFAVPSHPYKGYKRVLGDNVARLTGLRALETANGQNAVREPKTDARARNAAARLQLMSIGGSDAHFPENTGLCYTEFDDQILCERDFIRALQQGQYRAMVAVGRVWVDRSHAASLDRQARGGYPLENASFWNDNSADNPKKTGAYARQGAIDFLNNKFGR